MKKQVRVYKTPYGLHLYVATIKGEVTYGWGNTPKEARECLARRLAEVNEVKMTGPKVVCVACEEVEVGIAVPVCSDCLNKMVAARQHVPFSWCWCEPGRDAIDPHVLVHREIQ